VEVHGRRFEADRRSNGIEDSPLGYSGGTQTSRREQAPAVPAYERSLRRPVGEPSYPDFLSRDGDSVWSDDERDADRDGLSNIVEDHFLTKAIWDRNLAKCEPAVKPWEDNKEGSYYGAFGVRPFAEPTMMDGDTDGDGLLDAEDDQDNDDVPNYAEVGLRCDDGLMVDPDGDGPLEPAPSSSGTPNVNPYNPCAPHGGHWTGIPGFPMARTCPYYKPLDG
jgi:hypothetical protein